MATSSKTKRAAPATLAAASKATPVTARFASCTSGATSVEYGLIAAIVFLGIIASVSSLKQPLNDIFESVTINFQAILGS